MRERENPLVSCNLRAGTSCLCPVSGGGCPRDWGAVLCCSPEGWGQFGTVTDYCNSRAAVLPPVVSAVSAQASVPCSESGWQGKKNWGEQLFHIDIQSYLQIPVMALGRLLPYKCLSFSALSLYSSQGMYYQEDVL